MKGSIKQLMVWLSLQDSTKEYEVKPYKEKRSLNANSYYWKLLNEIGNKMRLSKEELHFKYLKEHGQVLLVPLLPTQNPSEYFKYYDKHSETILNRTPAIYYKIYKRSSDMTTEEFSILLDAVVQDAVALGIDTLDDLKVKEMLDKR